MSGESKEGCQGTYRGIVYARDEYRRRRGFLYRSYPGVSGDKNLG